MLTLPLQAHHAMEKMEEFVYKVWEPGVIPQSSFWSINEAGMPSARGDRQGLGRVAFSG